MTTINCSRKNSDCNFFSVLTKVLACIFYLNSTAILAISIKENYQKAEQLYLKNDFIAAQKKLQTNLNKNPKHKPSLLLMAIIAYKLEKYLEATKYFRTIKPSRIDPDSAFIYGVSHFAKGSCSKSIAGFKRVPLEHQLKNFARFYSGICYVYLRHYTKALIKLKKAKALPYELDRQRKKMIRTVQQKLSKRRMDFDTDRPIVVLLNPAYYQRRVNIKKTSEPEPKKSGFIASIKPIIRTQMAFKNQYYSDLKVKKDRNNQIKGGLLISTKNSSNPSVGLTLIGQRVYQHLTSEEEKFKIGLNSSPEGESQVKKSDTKSHYSELIAAPSVNLQLGRNYSFALKLQYYEFMVSNPNNHSQSHKAEFISYQNFSETIDTDFGVSYTESYNATHSLTGYVTKYFFNLSLNLKYFGAELGGSYLSRKKPGGDSAVYIGSETRISTTLTKSFKMFNSSFGVSYQGNDPHGASYVNGANLKDITATLNLEIDVSPVTCGIKLIHSTFEDYALTGLSPNTNALDIENTTKKDAIAGGNSITATPFISLSIWDWALLRYSYEYYHATYEIEDPQIKEAFLTAKYNEAYTHMILIEAIKVF